MKHLIIGVAVTVAATVAVAQNTNDSVEVTTSAQVTTSSVNQDAVRTSLTATVARNFSPELFEKRWEGESQMYREVGISEEKIKKLHDINLKVWNARSSGEKIDFQDLQRQRTEILDKEDIEKLRNARREAVRKKVEDTDQATTASASE